jgi:oxygen-independent coproporphyrinogen-3 oxidase
VKQHDAPLNFADAADSKSNASLDSLASVPTPRAAYIHVPFCRHRCGYCNFSVIAGRDDLIERFLRAIENECQSFAAANHARPALTTLFIGGGTPTHLSIHQLSEFLKSLRRAFDLDGCIEWSVEANPEDITDEKLALLADHGVNRISLGVQSFDDAKLRMLERNHPGLRAIEVIERTAGVIPNVSIDLIFAAPHESLDGWQRDLEIALKLPIQHLSTYALTFEKGTSFWSRRLRGRLQAADESTELQMYDLARKHTADAGFQHYEISNFSRPGFRCAHNLAYWRGDRWFAAGPGAAAFLGNRRTVNHRSTSTYLKRIETGTSPIAESEVISDEQLAREQAAFGVRLLDGIELSDVRQRTGVDIAANCQAELARLQAQGLIERRGDLVRLTERGVRFADTVASEFLG